MDRAGILMAELRDYDPVQPRGGLNVKRILERAGALALLIGGTALKWGFVFVKFFGIFISIAAYKLWFGSWTFALGFVLLILVHELGHAVEARRQGLQVSAPTFIPFFGAYVTIRHAGLSPWRNSLISLAGPFAGGLAALACWIVGYEHGSVMLVVLANIGFLLNAFNLLPIGFLDGGTIVRSISLSRRGWIRYENGVPVEAVPPDKEHANLVTFLYVALGVALVAGMLATRHSGML
jgi:Zn-dependent protease